MRKASDFVMAPALGHCRELGRKCFSSDGQGLCTCSASPALPCWKTQPHLGGKIDEIRVPDIGTQKQGTFEHRGGPLSKWEEGLENRKHFRCAINTWHCRDTSDEAPSVDMPGMLAFGFSSRQ